MSERPDKQRRKQLRDQWKAQWHATQDASARRRWLGDIAEVAWVFSLAGLFGFAMGALGGAFELVKKGVIADLWLLGRVTDLVWIALGALFGAGLVFLWGKLLRKKALIKLGVWAGAVAGAAVVAPANVAFNVLPAAAVNGLLFALACTAVMAGMMWSLFRPSTVSSLIGGAAAGAIMGAAIWLCVKIPSAARLADHGELGSAFSDLLSQLADDLTGIGTLVSAVAWGILGAVFLWRLDAENRAESKTA